MLSAVWAITSLRTIMQESATAPAIANRTRPRGIYLIEGITDLPYAALFVVWIGMAIVLGVVYFLLSLWTVQHGLRGVEGMPEWQMALNSLYFSIITATTTGYGDFLPLGISKIFACVQSIFAFFVFGVCISKLVSNRQETLLERMHRLSFEDIFHNVREGLFIARKDFDHVINKAQNGQPLTSEDWENLTIAYKQGQSLIAEIPNFYDETTGLYIIDVRREQLLQEAVHRTLTRIQSLLQILTEKNIPWKDHKPSMEELRSFLHLVTDTIPDWHGRSPHNRTDEFRNILTLCDRIEHEMV